MSFKKATELAGVNIQYPISQAILNREKSVETRTYSLPKKYTGVPLFIIETPGRSDFAARISGVIVFGESFEYADRKQFYADTGRHLVDQSSPWAWKEKAKWGWPIIRVQKFRQPAAMPKRTGIRFSTAIPIPTSLSRELDRFLKAKR